MRADLDFETLFRLTPTPLMLVDRSMHFVAANDAYCAAVGATRDALVGRVAFELFVGRHDEREDEGRARVRESVLRVFERGERESLDDLSLRMPVRRPDGSSTLEERLWQCVHTPVFDDANVVRFVMQHAVDITALRRAETERARAFESERSARHAAEAEVARHAALERRFEAMFEQSSVGIGTSDAYGVFVDVNPALCAMSGYSADELLGKSFLFITHPDDRDESRALLQQMIRGERRSATLEKRYVRKDGRVFWGFVTVSILRRSPDDAATFVTLVQDITARREAEGAREELLASERQSRLDAEQANRSKDEFLTTISHELRTPLNAILGWLQLYRSGKLTPERAEHALATVERNARAQAQVVEDLLDMGRIVAGKLTTDLRPTDVAPVVESAIEAIRPSADTKRIALHVELDRPCFALADANRLQQIVWNLLSNAVKFTPPNGQVSVRTACTDHNVVIEVRDSGIGIDPRFVPHLFERGRQADAGPTRETGGLGLGLSIVQHLVEMHCGRIDVESAGRGHGATFRVHLQRVADP